jgi:hypothetical protein
MMLLKPKYSKKITLLTMLSILAADLGTAVFCYLSGNLTLLSKLDIVLFAVLCFAVRPLFKDTFMQWLFSYLTVQNISDMVIILSFIGSRHLPYPAYTNSLLRVILFGAFLLILSRYVRPLYRQAVEHWTAYFAVALGLYITFNYYVLSSDDIVVTLIEQAVPLLLVIFIGLAAEVELDIPRDLTLDSLELSMVVSNLLENAIQACGRLANSAKPYLRFTCRSVGRLLLEMENPCAEEASLDESGYPVTCEESHGIGSKSVIAFAKKYDGELIYKVEEGFFRVRLLV